MIHICPNKSGHRTTLAWKNKKSLLCIKFKNFMIFFIVKRNVDRPGNSEIVILDRLS